MKNALITFVFLFLAACTAQEEDPSPKLVSTFSLDGKWRGTNWYCSNKENCVFNSKDTGAFIDFTVTLNSGDIIVSPGKWTKPSCEAPSCYTNDWVVSFISYSNDQLTIKWSHGYTFSGKRDENTFVGIVTYIHSAGEYVWNDNVRLLKK